MTEDGALLARAVINQALNDLRVADWRPTSTGKAFKARGQDAMEALHFLTDVAGAWAEARVLWCDLADIHPGYLRRQALAVVRSGGRAAVAKPHRCFSGAAQQAGMGAQR